MLNAIEPGSPLPIHRHTKSTETVVCLRGHLRELYYNDHGEVTEVIDLAPNSDCVALNIPIGQWHTVEVLESGTVIMEVKDGAYEPRGEEDIMDIGEAGYSSNRVDRKEDYNSSAHVDLNPDPFHLSISDARRLAGYLDDNQIKKDIQNAVWAGENTVAIDQKYLDVWKEIRKNS